MSVYNGERYLTESLASILNQTFPDFEFIIIDDGSSDNSADIIRSVNDNRIRLIQQNNKGLAYSLNHGINNATAPFIARMDADDIALPDRFKKQMALMKEDTDCIASGTWADVIDLKGNYIYTRKTLTGDEQIRIYLAKRMNTGFPDTPFLHSSVIFRKDNFIKAGGYCEHMRVSEDVVLFNKMSKMGRFRNIPEVLLKYRIVPESMSGIKMKPASLGRLLMKSIENDYIDHELLMELKAAVSKTDQNRRLFDYNVFIAKKFLLNNHRPALAREYLGEAIKYKQTSLLVIALWFLSYLAPGKIIQEAHKKLTNILKD